MKLGIILMDNNQPLFSPSPPRPGKLRGEAEEPGVSERGTRSGPALWNSPPPWRYEGAQPGHQSPGFTADLDCVSSKDSRFFYYFVRE